MADVTEFLAIIPDIQSAIRFFGSGGGRIDFEFPQSEEPNVIRLLGMRAAVLVVSVRLEDGKEKFDVQGGASAL